VALPDRSLATAAARAPTRGFRPLGLSRDNSFLALGMLLWGATMGFYQYVLPLYLAELGATPDLVGLALAVGNVGSVVAILVGGLLVDRYSRRKQIILSLLLSVIAVAIYGLAPSWQVVTIGGIVMGVTMFVTPVQNAYVAAAREGQDAGEAFTSIFALMGVGMAITPALGGVIIAGYGLRAVFAASFVCAVASTIAMFMLHEQPPGGAAPDRARLRGLARLGAPVHSYLVVLQDRPLRALLLILAGLNLAGLTGASLIPLYLRDRIGLAPGAVGTMGSGVAVVSIVVSLVLGRLSGRVGVNRAMTASQTLLLLGFALLLIAPGLGGLAVGVAALGFALRGGMQAMNLLARGAIADAVEGPRAGPGFALQSTLSFVAQVIGPILAGTLYARDARLPLFLAGGVGIALIVLLNAVPNLARKRRAAL
jgi:MFS family permease